jgi:purine-nucleoside phosphorylase
VPDSMKQPKGIGFEQTKEAANFIRSRLKIKEGDPVASVAVVLGSGLGAFAQEVAQKSKSTSIPYHDIPNFPTSSVEGHNSSMLFGAIDGKPLLVMQGRVHRYEGYSSAQVVFGIRVLQALGVRSVVLTNASGAIGDHLNVGDLMLITDHINLTGDNPLLGPNDVRVGPRFFDMSEAYSKDLRQLAYKVAGEQNTSLKEGIYVGDLGPSYETPAEIRAFKSLGADAVGMSTVFETIAARHGAMDVLGIACMTNKAAGLSSNALSHDEVTTTAAQVSRRFSSLLLGLVPELARKYE